MGLISLIVESILFVFSFIIMIIFTNRDNTLQTIFTIIIDVHILQLGNIDIDLFLLCLLFFIKIVSNLLFLLEIFLLLLILSLVESYKDNK